jgi:hypothetical protein
MLDFEFLQKENELDIFVRNISCSLLLHTENVSRIRLMISIQWQSLCHSPHKDSNLQHPRTNNIRHPMTCPSSRAQTTLHFRHEHRVMWSSPPPPPSPPRNESFHVLRSLGVSSITSVPVIHGSRDEQVAHMNTNSTKSSLFLSDCRFDALHPWCRNHPEYRGSYHLF